MFNKFAMTKINKSKVIENAEVIQVFSIIYKVLLSQTSHPILDWSKYTIFKVDFYFTLSLPSHSKILATPLHRSRSILK